MGNNKTENSKLKASALRQLDNQGLQEALQEACREYVALRAKKLKNNLENVSSISGARKNIARIKTVISMKRDC